MNRLYFIHSMRLILLCAGALLFSPGQPCHGGGGFGFAGPEIFPIDTLISHLRYADVNQDGKPDLIVANNLRSKINILINRTGEEHGETVALEPRRLDQNQLPPDARFQIESLASEKRILGLEVTDLNGDGWPDLAYYGEPQELIVHHNDAEGGWSLPIRWPIRDGLPTPNALASGDLNGDGKMDLLLLGEKQIYVLYQGDQGLEEPVHLAYSDQIKSIQILDIDGNQLDDLLMVNWESAYPFRFRLQLEPGRLGPEFHFDFMPIRSYWAQDLDGDRKTEVITIAQKSGRAQISNFQRIKREVSEDVPNPGQFHILPLNRSAKTRRGIAWGDVDGKTGADLVVAEPDSGELSLYLRGSDGTLESRRSFPTLTGISEANISDWDGDGVQEIFLLSADENLVGLTHYEDQTRIPFPKILPVRGKPLSMTVGKLQASEESARPLLFVIANDDGQRLLQSFDNGMNKQLEMPLSKDFKSNPSSVHLHDADQDGRNDLVILIPYENTKILRQKEDGSFEELDVVPPGGPSAAPWMSAADLNRDGMPELLMAQNNFLRALVLERKLGSAAGGAETGGWAFRVKEQINGADSSSRIAGAAMLELDSEKRFIFLLDSEKKILTVCEPGESGVWQARKNLPLPVTHFNQLNVVETSPDSAPQVALLGKDVIARLSFEPEVWELVQLSSYESDIQQGMLLDVISGDLNQDGRKDLVFLETQRHYVDIVTFEKDNTLSPASRWQVFEERTFRNRRNEIPEPREAMVRDLTGDGKNDLVVLVHDRILLYPQL